MQDKFKKFINSPEMTDTIMIVFQFLLFYFFIVLFSPSLWIKLNWDQIFSLFALYKMLLLIFYTSDPYIHFEEEEKNFNSLNNDYVLFYKPNNKTNNK